jgi:hypothetical protein
MLASQVIGLKSASIKPPTIALTPVAWLVSKLTGPRIIEMTDKMTNPTNEKNIPRPITLAVRMFYFWAIQGRVNAQTPCWVKITAMSFVIRCGTPDCEWGKKMADLCANQLNLCYAEFRKHCIQRHDL